MVKSAEKHWEERSNAKKIRQSGIVLVLTAW